MLTLFGSSFNTFAQYDDVYDAGSQNSSSYSNSTGNGDQKKYSYDSFDDDYIDFDDDDYYYATRIRRFRGGFWRFGYFSCFYMDPFWWDYSYSYPLFYSNWGYPSYGFGWSYPSYWGSCYPTYGYGWGNSCWNPYYQGYWGYGGYNSWNYFGGYNNGYYNGYYNGYNNGYWDGYYGNGYGGFKGNYSYGPRTSFNSGTRLPRTGIRQTEDQLNLHLEPRQVVRNTEFIPNSGERAGRNNRDVIRSNNEMNTSTQTSVRPYSNQPVQEDRIPDRRSGAIRNEQSSEPRETQAVRQQSDRFNDNQIRQNDRRNREWKQQSEENEYRQQLERQEQRQRDMEQAERNRNEAIRNREQMENSRNEERRMERMNRERMMEERNERRNSERMNRTENNSYQQQERPRMEAPRQEQRATPNRSIQENRQDGFRRR